MKLILIGALALLSTSVESVHLRNTQNDHKFLNMDSYNPLQIAQLQSGDWTAILPDAIKDYAVNLLGGETTSTGITGTGITGTTSTTSNEQLLGPSSEGLNMDSLLNSFGSFSHWGTLWLYRSYYPLIMTNLIHFTSYIYSIYNLMSLFTFYPWLLTKLLKYQIAFTLTKYKLIDSLKYI